MPFFNRGRAPQHTFTVLGLAALFALSSLSCGDDKQPTQTNTQGPPKAPRLSGNLFYEFVPYNAAKEGLDYSKVEQRPIRGARVALLEASDSVSIAEGVSDADGHYSFDWEGTSNVKLWIYSETIDPPIVVEDNTSGNIRYVLESAEIQADSAAKLDVVATTGWTGSAYEKPRLSAPFSVLDAVYTAARRFMDETTPPPVFPKLRVNWSVENRPETGNVALGQIDTSNWDGSEIYLLGKEDIDTDEFDTHVLVHEWGHSFEDHISRSDSPGGSHGYGDVLDPRLAFSEGFCNALSAIILYPNTVYSDSSGPGQTDGFSNPIETNDISASAKPGWYSETSVENIVLDVYDEANEPFDNVSLGLQGIYDVMTSDYKDTAAMTTIFPFLASLKKKNASASAALDTLASYHATGSSFGITPVADEWGSSETFAGDDPGSIPLYIKAKPGDSFEVTLTGGYDSNALAQNRFVRITGTGSTIKVTSTAANDVDLHAYFHGKLLDSAESTSGNESLSFPSTSGQEYVINIVGYGEVAGPYTAKIGISP